MGEPVFFLYQTIILMSHQEMSPVKEVHLTIADIKELNFCLQQHVQTNRQQMEETKEVSHQTMLREKVAFLEQIMSKLNG